MKKLFLFLLLALVALTCSAVIAQDDAGFDTNTPRTPSVAATLPSLDDASPADAVDPGVDGALMTDSPAGELPGVDPSIRLTWGQLIFGMITIIGTSLIAGGGLTLVAVRGIIAAVKSNVDMKDLIEKLYNSQPLDRRTNIRTVVDVGKDLVEIADEVTDGLPNTSSATLVPAPAN